jgi:flagellar basal-body rod protein FlgB
MIDKLVSKTNFLEKSLNSTWIRNEAISQNIANIDTPNYKRKTVAFEEYLNSYNDNQIKGNRTDERHMFIGKQNYENVEARIKTDNTNLEMRIDGNNVDIDNEMALMAQNSLKYNTLTERISSNFKSIRNVIKEGR